MKTIRILAIVQEILTVLIFFITVILIATCIVSVLGRRGSNSVEERRKVQQVNVYQSLKYDASKNDFTFGISSSYVHLEDEKYLFSTTNDEVVELISHFGNDEYKCTGTCICEQPTTRRSVVAMIFSKPILVLVAAVSSAIAITQAKTYFQEECESRMFYDDDTKCASITSEIDSCQEVYALSSTETEDEDEGVTDPMSTSEIEKDSNGYYYLCKGQCHFRRKYNRDLYKLAEELDVVSDEIEDYPDYYVDKDLLFAEEIPNLRLKEHVSKVEILRMLFRKKEMCEQRRIEGYVFLPEKQPGMYRLAINKFVEEELTPFCTTNVNSISSGKNDEFCGILKPFEFILPDVSCRRVQDSLY